MAVATPLELPDRFLRPLWAWIEATPVYLLVVLLIALVALALLAVRYCPAPPRALGILLS